MRPSFAEADGRTGAAGEIDRRKPGGREAAAGAVLLLVELEFDVARTQQHGAAPVQRFFGTTNPLTVGVDRLGEAVEAARLAGNLGFEAFARLDAIPAARHH